jgi:hypothetical protein
MTNIFYRRFFLSGTRATRSPEKRPAKLDRFKRSSFWSVLRLVVAALGRRALGKRLANAPAANARPA